MDVDHLRLSQAGIFYEEGRSEVGPSGQLRPGYARNQVAVEADDEDAAIDAVKDALGPQGPPTARSGTSQRRSKRRSVRTPLIPGG